MEKDLMRMYDALMSLVRDEIEKFDENEIKHNSYRYERDEYENGEKVRHIEKEVKDGNVIKDIDMSKNIENKTTEKTISSEESNSEKIKFKNLMKRNKELETVCNEYKSMNDNLCHRNKYLESAIKELETKLANIKSCLK